MKTLTPERQVSESGYRYYSPTLGRWINRDPIDERGGANRYLFVHNQPVSGADLLGLFQGIYDSDLSPSGDGFSYKYKFQGGANQVIAQTVQGTWVFYCDGWEACRVEIGWSELTQLSATGYQEDKHSAAVSQGLQYCSKCLCGPCGCDHIDAEVSWSGFIYEDPDVTPPEW